MEGHDWKKWLNWAFVHAHWPHEVLSWQVFGLIKKVCRHSSVSTLSELVGIWVASRLSNNNCAGLGASCQKQGNSKAVSRVQYDKRQSKWRTTFNVCTRQQNLIPSMTCFVGNYYMSHDHEIQIYSCTTLENNSEVTVSMAKRYTEESDFVFTEFPSRYSNHH